MMIQDIAPGLTKKSLEEQVKEALIRSRADIEVLLVSRHMLGKDRILAKKARDHLELAQNLMNKLNVVKSFGGNED